MKLLFIKIGKAWHTLRREGFMHGMKRIVPAGLALFGRVRPADVLFITGGVGDSARFRTKHVAEQLGFHGITSSVTVQDNPRLSSYADSFSVFVFHRVLFTASVAKLIAEIKKRGKEIVFETDDLVYDPKYLKHMDYWRVMNPLERKLYENGVGGEILADPYVKVATTTTSFLAEKLRERGKKVIIVPNRLSISDVTTAEALFAERSKRLRIGTGESVTIGYFSGAAGHDKDFSTITGALQRLLTKHTNLRLLIVGPLVLDESFGAFSDRIDRMHYVARQKHFENVACVDINIAPLEIGNPFCEGKSELKFFEAGILGVPTVAVATQTFREAITDGVDGFVAANESEWEDKLERLIADPDLRKRIGEAARKTALSQYVTTNADDHEYVEYLRNAIKRTTTQATLSRINAQD
ncbi:MAG: glycosyltransferase family 4 protein [Candidatus Moranbacteria bacterium]|nr:glycosyltransferase family 4 protein [Candidatus Moranbacteria bacterium]NTW75539.1 glycosyltransferase family 4 protein [Candidatus Moranbacteria bacterium]